MTKLALNTSSRRLFQTKVHSQTPNQNKFKDMSETQPKSRPLINNELSKKLQSHSLISSEKCKQMKTIAINLGSDDEANEKIEHYNYLDESIAKVEQTERGSNGVSQSYGSDETVQVSAITKTKSEPKACTKHKSKTKKNKENIGFDTQRVGEAAPKEEYVRLADITAKFAQISEQAKNEYSVKDLFYKPNTAEEGYGSESQDDRLFQKYEDQKKEILVKVKESQSRKELEEIEEAELSEYESSTIDERMQSNIANATNTDASFQTANHFELLSLNQLEKYDPNNLPILYIDIKITHDKVSRLVLYKNQTPYDAALAFIQKHNIPSKLRPYLINKVQAHYDKINI